MVHWTRALRRGADAADLRRSPGASRSRPARRGAGHHRCGVPAPVAAAAFVDAARQAHVPLIVVHVTAEDAVIRERLRQRPHDAQEVVRCRPGVYLRARDTFETPAELPTSRWLWFGLDDRSREAVREVIDRACACRSPGHCVSPPYNPGCSAKSFIPRSTWPASTRSAEYIGSITIDATTSRLAGCVSTMPSPSPTAATASASKRTSSAASRARRRSKSTALPPTWSSR